MSTTHTIEESLSLVPIFRHLSSKQRSRLAELVTRRSYRQDAVVVRQGDTSMSFYLVLSGSVRVERRSTSGERTNFGVLGKLSYFGEMGLIGDVERAATVVATEPTECALLAKWDFQNTLREDPEMALSLLSMLGDRIRELDARLEEKDPQIKSA